MRNGDFLPTRLQAQQDAVNLVTQVDFQLVIEYAMCIPIELSKFYLHHVRSVRTSSYISTCTYDIYQSFQRPSTWSTSRP